MATYLSNATGNWSTTSIWLTAATGTITPTAPAGAPPQSGGGDKIIIRSGHTVLYNVNGEFGDDSTYSTNLTSAGGIVVVGTLSASRTTSTSLTARGSITVPAGGTFDWGTVATPIPSSVNHQIVLNYSLTPAIQKHIFVSNGGNISLYSGLQKTRNTFLTLPANAGATQITVNDATNWVIGDRVILESDTTSVTREHITTISSVAGNVINLNTGLNFARLSGTRIGNFSSNITIRPHNNSFNTSFQYIPNNTSTCVINNVRFEHLGTGGGSGTSWGNTNPYNGPAAQSGLGIEATNLLNDFTIENLAFEETVSSATNLYGVNQPSVGRVTLKNSALRGTGYGAYIGSGAIPIFDGCTWYRIERIALAFGAGSGNTLITDCFINSSLSPIQLVGKATINNTKLRTTSIVLNSVLDTVFNNCTLQADTRFVSMQAAGALGTNIFNNCTFTGAAPLTAVHTTRSSDLQITKLNRPNNVDGDYRLYNYYYYGQTNSTVRKNGITSLRIKPNIANQRFNTYLSIPALAGVSQRIECNLRFDSTYGTANPPSISFVGAGVNQTFTCPAVADTWHNVDLTLNPTSTDDITVTISGQSASILGFVYLDGLPIDPYIQTARWYGFEVDKNAYRTVDTLTTLTENQVSSVDITNLDFLYDVSNYWTINNPLSTSYLDLFTKNGNILNFGNKNIIFDNSASTNFSYASASNTVTIKTPLLSAGNNFIGLRTTGTISVSSNSNFSYIDIYGNISQPTPVSLSGVYMEGTLSYNTTPDISIEYVDCAMDTVQNLGAGFVTIKKTNSTITNGNDPEILDYVPTLLDVQNLNGGYIAIFDDTTTRRYYQNSDEVIVLPAGSQGTWRYHIARYGFKFIQENFLVAGGTITINPDYDPDTFVTSDAVTVAAYTDLNTVQKIYNYLNYYTTTSEGINYDPFYSRAFGSLTINKNVTLNATASSVFNYNHGSSLVTLKCTSLNEEILFVSSNNITYINGTTLSDNIKIRAANLDSELIMTGITSLTLYPTPEDRDDNTNIGEILTGTIYRFLYGSTTPLGVPLEDYLYNRVNVSGTILLNNSPIAQGTNELQFDTTGTLQQIINNQKVINVGIQKASKLIPHTTNI
jgi:hypothetical protein